MEVFGENLRKNTTEFDDFWSESAKQTLRAAEENRTSIPFQLLEILEPEDGSGGTISCRPAKKLSKKIFFCQTILNGPIREKKHVSRNSKIFCPYDLTLVRHLENFRRKFFRPTKNFFCLTILNGPIREKNMFPEIRKIFALMA